MKVSAFKNLIKEAVREVVREELLQNQMQPLKEGQSFNFTSKDVISTGLSHDVRNSLRTKMGMEFGFEQPQSYANRSDLKVEQTNENPYLSFIADAASNMSAQDVAGLKNLG
jgi:hypothetical protein